ncbi:MAG: outer membrane beta-barrel protein [Verrucomicrobiales bacterium]|nr:outer membrane beta-barrel protein [Verrucomicrobiales bacterium]
MKTLSVFLLVTLTLCSVAQAGWGWDKQKFHSAKSPMVEQRVTSPSYCFDEGFEFSVFASGYWPEGNNLSNQLGGGFALGYFFGHNFGIEGSYALHGGGNAEHVGKMNLVYRFPLGGECCSSIAPYVFGGPGVLSTNTSEFLWNLGGGLDFRLEGWGCLGLFTDFSYNWVNRTHPDFTQIRAGVKIPF